MPPSRLPEDARRPPGGLGDVANHLLSTDPADRLLHARGQSFPDLVAMRSGQTGPVPDAVAHPRSGADVRTIIDLAQGTGAHVIPYGGGTSVVGGVNTTASEAPVLTVDLRGVTGLTRLNRRDQLATFGAGITGPRLEALLRADGLTLGHFPQSFELSTLGGWVATRSSGQQSLGYGRIERLFAGGVVESPGRNPRAADVPRVRRRAGPARDGAGVGRTLGIITEATVRVRPVPEVDDVHAVFLPSWDAALEATREIVQSGTPLSMLRLSTAEEAASQRTLAGDSRAALVLDRGLSLRGVGTGRCVLLIGVMGSAPAGPPAVEVCVRRRAAPRRSPCRPLARPALAARAVPHALPAQRSLGARVRHRHRRDRHHVVQAAHDARLARAGRSVPRSSPSARRCT